jgi:hypothetical protein
MIFGIAITSVLWIPAPSAAHRATTFDACVGTFHGVCEDHASYLAGDHPHISAKIRPRHRDLRAVLWRRPPHRPWERIATVAINDRGRMSWQWDTSSDDVRPHRGWHFQYRLPGHGRSDIVRVRISAPDF